MDQTISARQSLGPLQTPSLLSLSPDKELLFFGRSASELEVGKEKMGRYKINPPSHLLEILL